MELGVMVCPEGLIGGMLVVACGEVEGVILLSSTLSLSRSPPSCSLTAGGRETVLPLATGGEGFFLGECG